jgi:hypothetical protein
MPSDLQILNLIRSVMSPIPIVWPSHMSTNAAATIVINIVITNRRTPPSQQQIRIWTEYRLLEMRFGRALAGLDTHEIDSEIARRVLTHPYE